MRTSLRGWDELGQQYQALLAEYPQVVLLASSSVGFSVKWPIMHGHAG
ncbi:MAG: hypothetical protein R3E95_19270 [Thiolinea sp.]